MGAILRPYSTAATDDCKKNRYILNGVPGERSVLNTYFKIWEFSRQYILFGSHYKKISRFWLNSYEMSLYSSREVGYNGWAKRNERSGQNRVSVYNIRRLRGKGQLSTLPNGERNRRVATTRLEKKRVRRR